MGDFTSRFKEAFESSNLTQSELARRSGLTRAAIHDYLTGSYKPKRNRTEKIAQALHVNPDWLAGANVSKDGTEEVDFLTSDNLYLDKKQLTSDERQQMANFARGLRAASNIKNN